MDKSWIALGRTANGRMSKPYNDGVKLFLQLAMGVIDQNGNLLCPCIKCVNVCRQNLQNVEIHLLQYGIMQTYIVWHQHGEPRVSNEAYHDDEMRLDGDEIVGGIEALVEPLVDELNELWTNGALTYDASTNETFRMHAALLWTIHDWPAFGDISGWRTKGHYSCYTCNDEPYFQSLRSKTGYTNHRCYLPENHPERRKSRAYNGKIEKRNRSLELPVEKIQDQLNNVTGVIYGKHPSNRKRPRQAPNWTKVSILYELPYWKKRKLRHNIDVMHVEKNFSENVFGTMLGIDGKNKDTEKARLDLEDMNIRKELWLTQRPDGSYVKPRAIFSLTPAERDGFFEFLKTVKYPDGYAANISKSVNARNGRLTCLKSHDCHVLIQRILPIGMRGYVDKEISTTLFELGNFFQDLCSRTLRRSELEKLEERIIHILCKLEKIFPPAFFDVMIHLAVHLPREAILGGPVQYRWMYPIERNNH